MKRPPPPPSRPSTFLSQKKIRSYLKQPDESKKRVESRVLLCKEEPPKLLTAELRHAMHHAIQEQLATFKEHSVPLFCAFNKAHTASGYMVDHYIRYFDELCDAFLKMFSSLKRPAAYDPETGGFLKTDAVFKTAWATFHQKRAQLRILCRDCHFQHLPAQYKISKKTPRETATTSAAKKTIKSKTVKTLNQVLKPYKDGSRIYAHPWLDLTSWGSPNDKGNYTRKLGDKQFTLFQKNQKWNYVYDGKFGSTKHETLRLLLEETYQHFGDTIRRYG